MECRVIYKCQCNNREYPSQASLRSHKKTKTHQTWENSKELRDLKIRLTERDNEILSLQTKLKSLRDLNTLLMGRLRIDSQ